MKQRFNIAILTGTMIALAALLVTPAAAEAPTGYYNSLYGKSGRELKNAVHNLIRPHNVVTYGSLWYHFPKTDCRPENTAAVWDMYSDYTYYFSNHGGMNREHSLPKSWWGGDQNEAYTDLNHLYPSDADANTAKLNYPLGEVTVASFNNGVTRVGTPKTGQGGGSSVVFEPDNRYKGDFARTYFYMACCYQDYTWRYKYMYTENEWLTLNKWSIDMLLRWAREDPVSDKEVKRNDAVYAIQNNRNPFIDNPELIEYIWGDKAGMPYSPADPDPEDPDPTARLTVPTQNLQIEFGEIGLGKTLNTTVYVKGKHLTGSLEVQVYRDDAAMFQLSVSSIPSSTAMTEQGYPLVVTYKPTAVGKHTCRLLLSEGGITGSVGAELSATCLPAPSLNTPKALPASNVTSSAYTANWQAISGTVDYYIVNRTIYDESNREVAADQFTTEETSYRFTDLQPGQTHTYTVQAYRLGYLSPLSNVITIDTSGIDDLTATMPVAFLATIGGVLVKCSEPMPDVNIYDMSGRLVMHRERVDCDEVINLPRGIYIFTAGNGNFRPAKLVIK